MTTFSKLALRVLAGDLVAVLIFAAIGRASHGLDLLGIFTTAAPFILATLIGFLGTRKLLNTKPFLAWCIQWLIVANLGITLRIAFGGSFALSFWTVTLIFTALILGLGRLVTQKFMR